MELVSIYFTELEQILRAIALSGLQKMLSILEHVYHKGRCIFIMGNGGSAATASHLVLNLVKNTFTPSAPRVKAISLTDHETLIAAWSNGTVYKHAFAEQLANMMEPGDVVIGIRASGNSTDVINAIKLAQKAYAATIGLLRTNGGKLKQMVDIYVLAPGQNIEQEEDAQIILTHVITRRMSEFIRCYAHTLAVMLSS